jgi:hypothetical protein
MACTKALKLMLERKVVSRNSENQEIQRRPSSAAVNSLQTTIRITFLSTAYHRGMPLFVSPIPTQFTNATSVTCMHHTTQQRLYEDDGNSTRKKLPGARSSHLYIAGEQQCREAPNFPFTKRHLIFLLLNGTKPKLTFA